MGYIGARGVFASCIWVNEPWFIGFINETIEVVTSTDGVIEGNVCPGVCGIAIVGLGQGTPFG